MKITLNIIIIFLAGILTACSYNPNLKFQLPDVEVSKKKIDAELKFVSVITVSPLERNGPPIVIIEQKIPMLFQKSLKDALDKSSVFKEESTRKVDITAKIFKLKLPNSGLSMTTEVGTRYEIIDRKTEEILFSQDISSSGTASMDYISGTSRFEESINRAIRSNIVIFLQDIEYLTIKK